jgi:competence protein ComEA
MLFAAPLVAPGSAVAGVNVNTASQSELDGLPGIGPSKAAAIIQYRSENGPFSSVDALQGVPGIGAKTVETLRSEAEVGDGQTVSKQAAGSGGSGTPSRDAVNINTATAAALDSLPGIGPSKAAAIVADRDANGSFSSCAELTRVTGVGAKTAAQIKPVCKTSD